MLFSCKALTFLVSLALNLVCSSNNKGKVGSRTKVGKESSSNNNNNNNNNNNTNLCARFCLAAWLPKMESFTFCCCWDRLAGKQCDGSTKAEV